MQSHIIIQILLVISSILGLICAFFVLRADTKSWINRFLAIIVILADFWALSIYFTLKTGNLDLSMIAFFSTAWIIGAGNLLLLEARKKLSRRNLLITIIPTAIISTLSLTGHLMIKKIDVADGFIKILEIGPLFYAFYAFVFIYLCIFIYNAWEAINQAEGIEKLKISYIITGFVISAILGSIFNLVLPAFGIFQFNSLGPIFILFVSGGAAYAATKHYIYDYQVVLSELWAFLLLMICLVWLILNLTIFNIILFVFLASICVLFIRTTISEADKKIQLEKDKESLQKLDSLKDEFLQMAEHELNTPIGVIEGKLSMILDDNLGGFTAEQKEYLKPIFMDAKRLAKLSSNLFEVSEIDQGELKLFPEKTHITDLIVQIVSKNRSEAESKGLKLEIVAPEHLPYVNLDRDKIKKVLSNLVENAIKFTKTGLIRISAEVQKNQMVVSISDTGVGIKKEDINNIFDKFYQADRFDEIPMEQQGTGLNLYIAKSLIKLHNGQIWVDSNPGHGTTFSFSLPLTK